MSVKIPDFVLCEEHTYGMVHDTKTLPAGTFVKPIERRYLPKHVLEDERWQFSVNDPDTVFCYTHYGILPIPREKIRVA